MPKIIIDNGSVYYTVQGSRDSSDHTLLLIHGAGGTHLDWPPEIRGLKGAQVIAIDLPGHGRSTQAAITSIDDYSSLILHFIDELRLNNLIIIGHSMGGAIALKIGLQDPDKVRGLVLIATGARLRVSSNILEGIRQDYSSTVKIIVDNAWSIQADDELKDFGERMLLSCRPDVIHGDFLACNDFDVMNSVDNIKLPSLVICGTEDRLTPIKYSRYLADKLPRAKLVAVEGAGHMVMLEKPEAVARSILDFLVA